MFPYKDRVAYSAAGGGGPHTDSNKSVMSEATIGNVQIPRDHQQLGYAQRQNVVGGVPVVSQSPRVLRAGENVWEGVVDEHNLVARRRNELPQCIPPSQRAYNQGQQNAAIGSVQIPRDHQQLGYGQRQNVVGGVPVVSHSTRVLRAGENVWEGVVDEHNVVARCPNELYQGNPPSQRAHNQGQQNVYQNTQAAVRGHLAGAGGGQEERTSHGNSIVGQTTTTNARHVAATIVTPVDNNYEMYTMSHQAPFDPNLICPLCRLQYRIGEIQKYRKHVQYCLGH